MLLKNSSLCLNLKAEYQALIAKKEEFDSLLASALSEGLTPEREKNLRKMKAEIEAKRDALKKILSGGEFFSKHYIEESLKKIQNLEVDKSYIALGLAGVGTTEAMKMRQDLINLGANKGYIARGLAGVGTPEAMKMRQDLINLEASKGDIALSFFGDGSYPNYVPAVIMRKYPNPQ